MAKDTIEGSDQELLGNCLGVQVELGRRLSKEGEQSDNYTFTVSLMMMLPNAP